MTGRGRASGRFLLRLEPGLHAALREAAREAGVSLNEYCTRRLAAPTPGVPGVATDAVLRAAALLGEDLVGVVAFGSWARGESRASSDVDLLLVVADGVAITRGLYRGWDAEPCSWDGRRVEPHFVHLAAAERRPSGMWAEVALDGIVLFERGLRVSRRLVRLRSRIAEGRLVRRSVHGQPYWVEAA